MYIELSKISTVLTFVCFLAAGCTSNKNGGATDTSDTQGEGTDQHTDKGPDDLRIAVIGAGAAGLTAAHTLRKLGYKHITVFEKESRPGGKVLSYEYKGRYFELGAVWFGAVYETIVELATEYNIPFADADPPGVHKDGKYYTYEEYIFQKYDIVTIGLSATNMLKVKQNFPILAESGFAGGHDDLHLNLSPFAKKHQIQAITDIIASFITGCGYGYYEEVPAQYLLKLITMLIGDNLQEILGSSEGIPMSSFTNGWQRLWEAVAADLDVRYNAEVTKIARDKADGEFVIEVTAGDDTAEFDRVIIATPPEAYGDFLDMTPEEKDIFSRVQTYRYSVTLIEGENIPHGSVEDNIESDTIGGVNFFAHFNADTNVYSIYQLLPDGFTEDDAREVMRTEIENIGGQLNKIVHQKVWSYFPHFKKEDLDLGIDEKIRDLQGQKGTYYVGGLMSFETAEHSARFAKDLVKQHFTVK